MTTRHLRKTVSVVLGGVIISGISYCTYGYVAAEARVTALCAQITPGMSVAGATEFAATRGLNGSLPESGTGYLVESRTFGRYGCRVAVDEGIVREVVFTFAD